MASGLRPQTSVTAFLMVPDITAGQKKEKSRLMSDLLSALSFGQRLFCLGKKEGEGVGTQADYLWRSPGVRTSWGSFTEETRDSR